MDHVEAHLAGPVALEALATEAGLSPYHFAREFKRSVGTSPLVTARGYEEAGLGQKVRHLASGAAGGVYDWVMETASG